MKIKELILWAGLTKCKIESHDIEMHLVQHLQIFNHSTNGWHHHERYLKAPIMCHSRGSYCEQSTPCVLGEAAAIPSPLHHHPWQRACGCDPASDDRNSLCGEYTCLCVWGSLNAPILECFPSCNFIVFCLLSFSFSLLGDLSLESSISQVLFWFSVALGSIY